MASIIGTACIRASPQSIRWSTNVSHATSCWSTSLPPSAPACRRNALTNTDADWFVMPEHSIAKRCRAIHDFKAVVRWRSLANVLHADPRTFPTPSGEQHFAIIESTAPTTGPHRGANDGVKENCLNGTKFKIPVITSSPVRTCSSAFGCRSGFGAHRASIWRPFW